jgi:hypothetical protein
VWEFRLQWSVVLEQWGNRRQWSVNMGQWEDRKQWNVVYENVKLGSNEV